MVAPTTSYSNWVDKAAQARPYIPPPFGGAIEEDRQNLAKTKQANAAIQNNPGSWVLEPAYNELREIGRDPLAPENAEELEKIKAQKQAKFEKGWKDGPQKGPDFTSAFNHLMNFNIRGAIHDAIMAIPIVGDIVASIKDSIGSLLSGKPLSPITAFSQRQEQKHWLGAAESLGLTADRQTAFVSAGMSGFVPTVQDHAEAHTNAKAHYRKSVEAYAKANPLIIDEEAFVERVMGQVTGNLDKMDPYAVMDATQKNIDKAQKFTQITGNAEVLAQDRAQLRDDIKNSNGDTTSRDKLSTDFKTMAESAKLDPELMKLNLGKNPVFDITKMENPEKILVIPPPPPGATGPTKP